MERSEVLAVIDRYVDALNAHDVEVLLEVFSGDAQHTEPVGTPTRSGEELRTFFEATSQPGWSAALHGPPTVVGERAAFVLAVTVEGDPPFTLLSTDLIRVDEDGKIAEFTAYPDWDARL